MVAWVPLVKIQFISRGEVTDCNFFLYLGVLYVKSKNYIIIHVFIEILLVLFFGKSIPHIFIATNSTW
jgi:hypothetical protein